MKYNAPMHAESENAPYIDGDPVTGIEGSAVPAKSIEYPQREIVNAIEKAGLTPTNDKLDQLALAIETIAKNKAEIYGTPKGGVIMWNGSSAEVPKGWALCNGENDTPDLRNRFIVGAGGKYAVGATGGGETKTTSASGSHTHSVNINTNAAGGHLHSFSRTTSAAGSHYHSMNFWSQYHTLSVSQIPSHHHVIQNSDRLGNTDYVLYYGDRGTPTAAYAQPNTRTLSTGGGQGHRHVVKGNTSSVGNHSHSVSGNTTSVGNHSHNVSGNTSSIGNHTHTVNVLPPYYALAFIMKL